MNAKKNIYEWEFMTINFLFHEFSFITNNLLIHQSPYINDPQINYHPSHIYIIPTIPHINKINRQKKTKTWYGDRTYVQYFYRNP